MDMLLPESVILRGLRSSYGSLDEPTSAVMQNHTTASEYSEEGAYSSCVFLDSVGRHAMRNWMHAMCFS